MFDNIDYEELEKRYMEDLFFNVLASTNLREWDDKDLPEEIDYNEKWRI